MTEENRRANISDEVARAEAALAAADALAGLGLAADSVSRSYYGAFHYLRALLFSAGTEARTHAGAIHLFNISFVRPGLFLSSHNRLLAGLQRSRELADYDAAVELSAEDARAELADARRFAADVRAYLIDNDWLRPEG